MIEEKIELLTEAINRLSDLFCELNEQKRQVELLKKRLKEAEQTMMRCLIVKKTPVEDVIKPYLIKWDVIKQG